jgi:arsenate reductase (glutaredoxin)
MAASASGSGVTIYHNPRCSKSRAAMHAAEAVGVDVDVVRYLEAPPDEATLRELLEKLEDPPHALVRRDDWKALGITADDVADADGVVAVLRAHPELMERPVLVKGDRAIIGRPTERAEAFLRS